MVLRETDVDSIRNRVADGRVRDLAALDVDGATLGAVFELACARVQWRAERRLEAEGLVGRWAARVPALQIAFDALTVANPGLPRVADFAAPMGEFLVILSRDDWEDTRALLFQSRFARTLQANGFSRTTALGLAGAFAEMADNIVQHSGENSQAPARGVVGYHVQHRWVSFAAADIGRGVLASLRSSERWRTLQNDEEALTHAIQHGASSRETALTGSGFAEVHRALADLSGKLRFRSGRGCLFLDGQGRGRFGTVKTCEFLVGFQLSVACSLDANGGKSVVHLFR